MISENPKRVTNQSGLLIKSVPKIIKGDNKHTIKAYLSLIFRCVKIPKANNPNRGP